jgi:hypothetical protein
MIGFSGRDMALIIHNGSMLMATLLLLCVLTWVLSHPYRGLIHDAGLYTLQAMSHLHPGTLSGDAFLRFGSQDTFTIFSPLYAWFIQAFGVEPAAAALTLCAQVAVLASAWLLARSVSHARLAMLGLFVLLAIPGFYGADRVFTCIESFLTPRMLAEALVLAGLACLLRERRVLAIALMLLAALFHPIMAVAGCAALLCAMVAIPYPGTACILSAAGLGFAAWLSGSIDPAWLALIRERSPYLFLGNWHLEDWAPCAVTLATLFAGQGAGVEDPARKLCRVVLITTLGGLALTAIGCDGLHLLLLTQLQPWRCLWLGTAVAALMLPLIVVRGWQSGLPGRASCMLLLAAWLFASNECALEVLVLLALTSAVSTRLAPAHFRWVYRGAWLLLAVALAWRVATNLEFSDAYYLEPGVPLWIRRTVSFVHDGSVPAAIGAAFVWLGTVRPSRGVRVGLGFAATAAALAILYLAPLTWRAWRFQEFSPRMIAQYAPLRAALPAHAEVFVPEGPLTAWLLLDRPSYLSLTQTSGLVFSRAASVEFQRRAMALDAALPSKVFMGWDSGGTALNLSVAQLQQLCAIGAASYLLTSADLGMPALATVPREPRSARALMRLYRC